MRSKTDSLTKDSSIKYLNLIEWIGTLSIPERNKLIIETQIDTYFNELEEYEVVDSE